MLSAYRRWYDDTEGLMDGMNVHGERADARGYEEVLVRLGRRVRTWTR